MKLLCSSDCLKQFSPLLFASSSLPHMLLNSALTFAVLTGLELQCGQVVNEILEKKFTGDVRLGLKVLGRLKCNCKRLTAALQFNVVVFLTLF